MKRVPLFAVAVVAALIATGSPAIAQSGAPGSATVKVDFDFVFAGTPMAAGSYVIESTPNRLQIKRSTGDPQTAFANTVTRLGRHDMDAQPELVFDKLGGKFHLSEMWFPGQDGYLLLSTKEEHDHRVLGGSNPRK
jgi:hypothetical protein